MCVCFAVWAGVICVCCLGGVALLFFLLCRRATCFFFAVCAGTDVVFLLFGRGQDLLLLFERGPGIHPLTNLPGRAVKGPTTKKNKQQQKNKVVPLRQKGRKKKHATQISWGRGIPRLLLRSIRFRR